MYNHNHRAGIEKGLTLTTIEQPTTVVHASRKLKAYELARISKRNTDTLKITSPGRRNNYNTR